MDFWLQLVIGAITMVCTWLSIQALYLWRMRVHISKEFRKIETGEYNEVVKRLLVDVFLEPHPDGKEKGYVLNDTGFQLLTLVINTSLEYMDRSMKGTMGARGQHGGALKKVFEGGNPLTAMFGKWGPLILKGMEAYQTWETIKGGNTITSNGVTHGTEEKKL